MVEYSVDVPIGMILRRLHEDAAQATPLLQISASKSCRIETDFDREAFGIAEDEDDLQLVIASGVMEIRPREEAGWRLQVRIEDTPAVAPVGGETWEDDDDLSLEAFEEEFILPEKGEVDVTVEVADEDARARFDRWLADILDEGQPR